MAFTLKGMKELDAAIKAFPKAMLQEAGKALYTAAREKVENVAMGRVPIMHGALKGTIETRPPEIEGGQVIVRVVCGGPAAPYAIAVHEHLSESSPPSWQAAEAAGHGVHFNVGGPKFLESALNDAAPGLVAGVAARFEITRAVRAK